MISFSNQRENLNSMYVAATLIINKFVTYVIKNNKYSDKDLGLVKNGVITPALNHAAATVLVNSDNDFN